MKSKKAEEILFPGSRILNSESFVVTLGEAKGDREERFCEVKLLGDPLTMGSSLFDAVKGRGFYAPFRLRLSPKVKGSRTLLFSSPKVSSREEDSSLLFRRKRLRRAVLAKPDQSSILQRWARLFSVGFSPSVKKPKAVTKCEREEDSSPPFLHRR